MTTIGANAFGGCTNLTNATLEEGIIEIQARAFNTERQLNALVKEYSKLASLTIPVSVQVMDSITAEQTDIIFAGGRTTLGKDISFYISAGRSITIPASVTKIEAGDLWLSEDATMYYGGTEKQWQALYEKYGGNRNYQSLWDAKVVFGDGRAQEFVMNNGVLEQYRGPGGDAVVPGNVPRVADHAFTFNSSFVDKYSDGNHKIAGIVFPEGVEEIGSSACRGLSNLTGVTLPKSLESIGEGAFGRCRDLTTVTFRPDSNTDIGNFAFSDCEGLVTVTLPNSGSLGEFCFSPQALVGSHRVKSVTVPAGVAAVWSAFVDDEYLEGTVETVYGVPASTAEYWATRSNGVTFVPIALRTPPHPSSPRSPRSPPRPGSTTCPRYVVRGPLLWAVEKNVTLGTGDGVFSPTAECTQIQILTFLWRAAGRPDSNVTLSVAVTENAGYAGAARWATEKKMIDGSFAPNAPCRGTAIKFIRQALGASKTGSASSFSDVAAGTVYAEVVSWAVEKGITMGTSDTTFEPNKLCDRIQIVTLLYWAYK